MPLKKLIAFVLNRAHYVFEIVDGLWTQAPILQRQYSDIVFLKYRIQTSSCKILAIYARNAVDINRI